MVAIYRNCSYLMRWLHKCIRRLELKMHSYVVQNFRSDQGLRLQTKFICTFVCTLFTTHATHTFALGFIKPFDFRMDHEEQHPLSNEDCEEKKIIQI